MRLQAVSAFLALLAPIALIPASGCTGDEPHITPTETPDGGAIPASATCDGARLCAGGAACVDGFCCDGACTGTCEACNVAGKEGRCSPTTGKPRRACDGEPTGPCAGNCDGKNGAVCTFPEVACGPPSCAGGQAKLAANCKAGTCQIADTQKCALGCFEDGCLGVKQLAGGRSYACAVLTDKHLRCWGDNDTGQTGQITSAPDVVPTPTEVNLAGVEMVAAAGQSVCALLSDKTVKCMGSNSVGQLGNGTVDALKHPAPTTVPTLSDVIFIGGGSGSHYCAITTSGTVKCWGSNFYGQLGDGTIGPAATPYRATPVTVCQPGVVPCTASTGATFVAGGDSHTCAAFAGGKVACWGSNASGELGQAVGTSQPLPQFVTPALTGATSLTAGNRVSCAAAGGLAKCWGSNGLGNLGHGTISGGDPVPKSVCTKQDCSAVLMGVTGVTTFDESSCGLAGGVVKCWGTNTGGQLGDGNATTSQSYAASSAIAGGAVFVTSVGAMNFAIVVDRANRDIRCWGGEFSSECGTGLPSGERKTPVAPKW